MAKVRLARLDSPASTGIDSREIALNGEAVLSGRITVERINTGVVVIVSGVQLAPGSGPLKLGEIPQGFRSVRAFVNYFPLYSGGAGNPRLTWVALGGADITWVGDGNGNQTRPSAVISGQFEYNTKQPWPT